MILGIAVSVYLILMIFIAFMVNSFMYIPSTTTLITQDYPGNLETSFSVVTAWEKILYVSTILLIFEI